MITEVKDSLDWEVCFLSVFNFIFARLKDDIIEIHRPKMKKS